MTRPTKLLTRWNGQWSEPLPVNHNVPGAANAYPGETVQFTVASGATVSIQGATPVVSAAGTTRFFTAPIYGSDTNLIINVTSSGVTKSANLLVRGANQRVKWKGAWVPSYRVIGLSTNANTVIVSFGTSGTLLLSGSGSLTASSSVSTNGALIFTGSGTLSLTGSNGVSVYPSNTFYPSNTTYPGGSGTVTNASAPAAFSGSGSLNLAGVSSSTVTVLRNSTLENAAISSPIVREDMWDFTGANVSQGGGSYSNFTNTSVVSTTGRSGSTSKVLDQFFPAVVSGSTSNYAMPPTGTGIALTSAVLNGGPVDEASIEFDFRAIASGGPPWGWGGKIPGLGGKRPSVSSVPSGGQPSPNGWSARMMFRRIGTTANANMSADLVGYFYSPNLPAGAIGNDIPTGKTLQANTWHRIKQYYKMNTVTSEGSTNPPADGIHRIWLDGVLCYESTSTVFRFYTDANITSIVWDNFYGGSDAADGKPWGPVVDVHHQFDNLLIQAGA